MSGSKYIDKIAIAVTVFVIVLTILFMNGSRIGIETMAHTMGYEERLFDNSKVHTIDIVMDNWDEFIQNATSEEYYTAAMFIDGEAYKNVGIRGKGNTSLSTVSAMNSDRYSFKVEFDHYDDSITYHGLDKLSLNNLIQDTTMMKDYLTYTMMREFQAAAPLCSFVYITVNGKDWGLYLAVEGIEDSFLKRNYGTDYGKLYKPDSMNFGGGRGNGKDFRMDDFMNQQEAAGGPEGGLPGMENFDPGKMPGGFEGEIVGMENFEPTKMPEGFEGEIVGMENFDPGKMPGEMTAGDGDYGSNEKSSFRGKSGFGGMGSLDVKLQYIDDDTDSYSNIWNNAKTDINAADQARLIQALKKLSEGEQLEEVVDIEAVIRYFVVHNYVCNGDSYTGSMIHNYYLYEKNGQMSMLPWDYNLAFGTFQGGNGQSTVNTPIDAPVSGGQGEDRPMWNWILSDERYTDIYHQYYEEFLNKVDVQTIIHNAYNLIKPYVEKDPTAFYTYDEFEAGVKTIREFCRLRSESISMQLKNGETISDMNYVDASSLTLSDMGTMGGGFGGMPGGTGREMPQGGRPGIPEGEMPGRLETQTPEGDMSDRVEDQMRDGDMLDRSWGEVPEGFVPSGQQGGFEGMFPGKGFAEKGNMTFNPRDNIDGSTSGNGTFRNNMQMPRGDWETGMNGNGNSALGNSEVLLMVISVLILGAGILAVKLYRH